MRSVAEAFCTGSWGALFDGVATSGEETSAVGDASDIAKQRRNLLTVMDARHGGFYCARSVTINDSVATSAYRTDMSFGRSQIFPTIVPVPLTGSEVIHIIILSVVRLLCIHVS